MKRLLALYARYNAGINESLSALMLKVTPDDLHAPLVTHYGSLHRLYHHLATGAWHYLTAVNRLSGGKYCDDIPPLPEYSGELEVGRISEILDTLSEILIRLTDQIPESDLETLRRGVTIYNGRKVDITLWQFLLQHVTHQTHHQGQISILLDQLGLEHEFGNVFPLIPDATQTS